MLRPEPLGREEAKAKAKEEAGAGPGPSAEPSDAAPVEQLGEHEAVVRDEDGEVAGEAGRLNAARTAGLEAEAGGVGEERDGREAAGGNDGSATLGCTFPSKLARLEGPRHVLTALVQSLPL